MYIQGITIVFLIWTILDYYMLYRKVIRDKSELENEIEGLEERILILEQTLDL